MMFFILFIFSTLVSLVFCGIITTATVKINKMITVKDKMIVGEGLYLKISDNTIWKVKKQLCFDWKDIEVGKSYFVKSSQPKYFKDEKTPIISEILKKVV